VGAVLHLATGMPARMERGAARIGTVPDWARIGLPALGLLIIAGVWILVARVRKPDARVLDGLAPVAAITALLLCATVLSPQYVSWLLPFAAIAAAGGERAVAWLAASTAFLSTLGLNLVKELDAGETIPMLVVLARNAALLALLVTAVVRIVRLARHDRAREPIPSGVPVFAETAMAAVPAAIRRPEAEPVVPVPM
jgi:hypothetical protein